MMVESSVPTSPSVPKSKSGRGQRKSSSLPAETVDYLKAWMMSPEHVAHPYPTEQEKAQIMADTGIELKQLTNWFVNNRKRYWKPRVEARLQQQAQAAAAAASAHAAAVVAAVSAAQVSPVTPDNNLKPTLNLGGNNFLTFELPRSTSQTSFIASEASRPQMTQERTSSLHVISENSSASSASMTDSEEGSNSSPDDELTEATFQCEESCIASIQRVHQTAGQPSSQDNPPSMCLNKRVISESSDDFLCNPRKRFRRVSLETWKDACQEASNVYCDSLPTLEEAVKLFGYSN